MKLLLIRHGESVDDVENRYGGWVDFPLTPRGESQAADAVNKIKGLKIDFRKIYSSPLSRAVGVAEIFSKNMKIDVEIYEYLKEHNVNGLLSGMEKEKAKKKYPEEVAKRDSGETVDGAEDERAFLLRAKKGIENLVNANKDSDIIAVTHGGQVRAFFRNYFNQRLSKLEDLAFVLIEWQDEPQVISTSGIEVDQTDS